MLPAVLEDLLVMGSCTPRRRVQAVWLIAGLFLALPALSGSLSVSRLDADPVPTQVTSGALDHRFIAVPHALLHQRSSDPRWWRVTADEAIPATGGPHLVLQSPHLTQIETWAPGRAGPLRRALTGRDADRDFSTRALVVPLPDGLAAGSSVYLRVHALSPAPMPVSIESLAEVHRSDLTHVAVRWIMLSSLVALAVLALGFWLGIGQRGYAFLALSLLAHVGFFATSGGEVRMIPGMAEVAVQPRVVSAFGLLGMLASLAFVADYLELRLRQPLTMRLLQACGAMAAALLLAHLLRIPGNVLGLATHAAVLLSSMAMFVASVVGTSRRQRAAYFLLVSWLPMMVLLWMCGGEMFGLWLNPRWATVALPATFVLSGLVITIGLGDTMQQLRNDRDAASRLATFDELTGTLTRPAVEAGLKAAVAQAHRSGKPLSVVFFDIDRFKRINDEHGHRIGDSCLRIIGLRTRNRLRTYDLLGRFGGDEVLVVLPDTRLAEALGVAENLRSAVNCRPLSIDGRRVNASLSLGAAELAAGESAEHLLERADEALYASKSGGRDRVTGHNSRVTASRPRIPEAQE